MPSRAPGLAACSSCSSSRHAQVGTVEILMQLLQITCRSSVCALQMVKLKAFKKFENTADALMSAAALVDSKMSKTLKKCAFAQSIDYYTLCPPILVQRAWACHQPPSQEMMLLSLKLTPRAPHLHEQVSRQARGRGDAGAG